jgi:hypothetical protein
VDNAACGQVKSRRNPGFSGRAAPDGAAGIEQFWSCSPVNGAIHPATAQQTVVGCIYNRVNLQRGNIACYQADGFIFHFRLF